MSSLSKQVQYSWISLLRISATLAVVFLHVNGTVHANRNIIVQTETQTVFFTLCSNLMIWAVPVFFMITGFLLLNPNKNISLDLILKQYIKRILLALSLFSIPYGFMKYFGTYGFILPDDHRVVNIIIWGINICCTVLWYFLTNNSFSHLWYLYELIGIYFILPIIKHFINNSEKQEQKYILLILFLFDFFFPYLKNIFPNFEIAFHVPISYSIFYLLAGYYFGNHVFSRHLSLSFVLLGNIVIVVLTLLNQSNKFLVTNCPIVPVIAMGIFGYVKSFDSLNKDNTTEARYKDFVWKLDRLCFTVYLIHPLFIQTLYRVYQITPVNFHLYPIAMFVIYIIVLILSFTFSFLCSKIFVLKKILY